MSKIEIVTGLLFALKGIGMLWGVIMLYLIINGNIIEFRAWRRRRQAASALLPWHLAWQRIVGGHPQPSAASSPPPGEHSPNP